jgi:hypothetical protein
VSQPYLSPRSRKQRSEVTFRHDQFSISNLMTAMSQPSWKNYPQPVAHSDFEHIARFAGLNHHQSTAGRKLCGIAHQLPIRWVVSGTVTAFTSKKSGATLIRICSFRFRLLACRESTTKERRYRLPGCRIHNIRLMADKLVQSTISRPNATTNSGQSCKTTSVKSSVLTVSSPL